MTIKYTSIGTLKTPHQSIANMPIQPSGADNIEGVAELLPNIQEGLVDLDGFSHIILIYHLHEINGFQLTVTPFMDNKQHGIFATRSPKRPNPIGISIVKVSRVEQNKVYFTGADMLNDTPLLDIKPFFRQSDNHTDAISGWLDSKDAKLLESMRSDNRFE